MKKVLGKSFLIALVVVLSIACGSGNQSGEFASDKLTGEWRNISINVTMETVNGSDSSVVFKANQENWVQKLGIKPIRTFYNEDGSYVSKYYAPNDSLVRQSSGSWEVKSDSLYMYQTNPDSITYVSAFTIENDTARFEMTLDWDQDGVRDDHYVGVQEKQSN